MTNKTNWQIRQIDKKDKITNKTNKTNWKIRQVDEEDKLTNKTNWQIRQIGK